MVSHPTIDQAPCIVCSSVQTRAFQYVGFNYLRCAFCGLVSTYPLPTADEIENHYHKHFASGNYNLYHRFENEYRAVYENFADEVEARLQLSGKVLRGLRVLDVGCFTGDFLRELQRRGADVYGLELQEEAVQIASKKLPGRIFKADVFSNDFPTGLYDVVTLCGVIEHVPAPLQLLGRCTDLLKPGGLLLLQTPDSGSIFARVMGKYWPPYAPIEHIHLFTRKALTSTLENLNYKEIQYKRHWKFLPLDYIYNILRFFGPEFYRFVSLFYRMVPQAIRNIKISFYVGEIFLTAQRKG